MNEGMGMLSEGLKCETSPCVDSSPTMLQKLLREKARQEERLARVNAAIEALNKNPELAGILETIRQAM